MLLALPLILGGILVACGQPTPSPMPSLSPTPSALPSPSPTPSAAVQQHDCGNLTPDICEAAIAAVVRQVPGAADSRIAVATTLDPDRLLQRGGDFPVLVAFARWDQGDLWFDPPTWVATQPTFSSSWRVEPWRDGDLPAHFVALLRQAGVSP